jgi:hypothetical protein
MTRKALADTAQLGFDSLLIDAEAVNRAHRFEKAHGHLPGTMKEAVPFYRDLIDRHHSSMLDGDHDTVIEIRGEASKLALKLNRGNPGILAGPEAPGCMLALLTAAPDGVVPLWGQDGSFIIETNGMPVRIELEGMFGIGACYMPWLNFSAHAVDWNKPFLSETGYRSFMGLNTALVPGLTPEQFAVEVIASHVRRKLKGKPVAIDSRYRPETAGHER